jgi:hypothetical protein
MSGKFFCGFGIEKYMENLLKGEETMKDFVDKLYLKFILCCKLKKKWCFVPFKKVKILVQF